MKIHLFHLATLVVFSCLVATSTRLFAAPASVAWSIAELNQILASVQPGQKLVTIGDMQLPVSGLTAWRNKLAGAPSPQSAFDGFFPPWTNGKIYYTFSTSGANAVPANLQKAFLDAAAEWAMFANIQFIPWSNQPNYVTVQVNAGLEGGQSAIGMVGGQQFLSVSPDAWNRGTLCHEIGHTLGLDHEHQRSDRDMYVEIITNNIEPGGLADFVLLPNTVNETAYDFYSVMHYARNYLSVDTNLDTIITLPAYTNFINIMGVPGPVVLSDADRAGMAAVYGPGPGVSSVVTNTQDNGPGSLRAALYYAFDNPNTTITFDIPASDPGYTNGVFTIQPSDQLPGLVNGTIIDGSTQPTNADSNPNGPVIQINGALAPVPSTFASGLSFEGTNCAARSLVINGFANMSILMQGTNCVSNTVSGCYLGIDPSGTVAVPDGIYPVGLQGGANGNIIGGTTAPARNIISGAPFQGVFLTDPGTQFNVIEGNYIGLNAAGNAALPNGYSGVGIFNGAQSNLIGGTVSGARNIISGNTLQGVAISDTNTLGNVIEGNYIGLSPDGTAAISNGWAGVNIFNGAWNNSVGGAAAGAGNVISGNGLQGVALSDQTTSSNVVAGNFIGLDPTGSFAISNVDSGVEMFNGAWANVIGGTSPGAKNIISGNGAQGVVIDGDGSDDNIVSGNWIGLNSPGNLAIPNAGAGVGIFSGAQENLIGGSGLGVTNVISGNAEQGVAIGNEGTMLNIVSDNLIGLNPAGTSAIPNTWAGVEIFDGASLNNVGDSFFGAGNVISGNGADGVAIDGLGTANNQVQCNLIGLNASGTAAVPNTYSGVEIYSDASGTFVGGPGGARNFISGNASSGVVIDDGAYGNFVGGNTIGLAPGGAAFPNFYAGVAMFGGAVSNIVGSAIAGTANLIVDNSSDGVQLFDAATTNNSIRGNSIYGNGGSGIALYTGANNSTVESAPTLASAVLTTQTTVSGSLITAPSAFIFLDVYASPPPTATAQATTYLGSQDLLAAPDGTLDFVVSMGAHVPIGYVITATATDPAGNTSALSGGVTILGTDSVGDGIPDAWRQAYFGGNGASTNASSCATCDPDQDGMDNLQEFLAGTDPENAASALFAGTVSVTNQIATLSFSSVSGITYRVEYKNNLSASGWTVLADQVVGTGGIIQVQDSGAINAPKRFYRLDVLP